MNVTRFLLTALIATTCVLAQKANSNSNATEGAGIYQQRCAACHGADGKGTSRMPTPDFSDPKTLGSLTDKQIVTTIKQGVKSKGMPAWADVLSDSEIHDVAAYIRTLSSTGSAQPGHGSR